MAKQLRMRALSSATLVAATLWVVALAGCGGSSSSSSAPASPPTSSSTPAITTTQSTTTSTSTGSTPSVASTPVAGRPSPCVAAMLSLGFIGQQGATGHGELGFALRNVSRARCRTFGFPGILFLDRAGRPLPTNPLRRTHDLFGVAPRVPLVIAPGASASFRIGVTHGINSSAGCHTAYGLQVIPPDDTASLRTTIPGGGYECTQATVSPLRPGLSAYP